MLNIKPIIKLLHRLKNGLDFCFCVCVNGRADNLTFIPPNLYDKPFSLYFSDLRH